eukprot:4779697-Alexandrium_andersonii.AAC.1
MTQRPKQRPQTWINNNNRISANTNANKKTNTAAANTPPTSSPPLSADTDANTAANETAKRYCKTGKTEHCGAGEGK